MRSAPPGFSSQISVNSFDCPALAPGRTLTAFFGFRALCHLLCGSWALIAFHFGSANHFSARRPGMKQYSPPHTTTNRGSP